MSTGTEIVKSFVKLIHTRYALNIPDFEDSVDNDLMTTDQAITEITSSASSPVVIKGLVSCFMETNLGNAFMIDQFVNPTRIEIIDFTLPDYRKRNRAFCISDPQFGYLSTKLLLKFNPISTVSSDQEGYKTLVDFICGSISLGLNADLQNLLTIIENGDQSKGLLIHKFAHTYPSIGIYTYLYFSELIRGDRIELDPSLTYTGIHGATIAYNHAVIYQQYFELFDIINEINHSSDIITRFLKVYHMLEYMVYRVELVMVETKARVNRTFIREIHGLAGKGSSEKEWDIFRKNFSSIFEPQILANYFNLGTLTPNQNTFFLNYFGLKNYNSRDPNQVSKLIYRLRNSIVHNKESEFHMTTSNPEDYSVIIPLVNLLTQKLEYTIFDKISKDDPKISYQSSAIQLY